DRLHALRLATPVDSPEPCESPTVAAAGTARNSPCPCGSGVKYKRCCGHHAPPVMRSSPPRTRLTDECRGSNSG
ncbi:MAG: SEC-C metal-binding domain-containing protein, partial [Bryobacteraceae bacterium]